MGTAAWLVPLIATLISTGVGAATSIGTSNKQLEAQRKAQQQQEYAQNKANTLQALQAEQQQRYNDQNTLTQFKNSLTTETGTGITTPSGNISGIAGLGSMNGYINEYNKDEDTVMARCGGKFKKVYGGNNKLDRASLFVSPNNVVNKRTNNTLNTEYSDRLAQFKCGGRKC